MHFKHLEYLRRYKLPAEIDGMTNHLWVIIIGISIYSLSWAMVNPIFPLYLKQIAGNYTWVGILFSLLYVTSIFLSIPIGNLIDRVNNTKLCAYGMFTYPLMVIAYIASSFFGIGLLIFTRATHSFTNMVVWLPVQNEIRTGGSKKKSPEIFAVYHFFLTVVAIMGGIALVVLVYFSIITESNLELTFIPVIPLSLFVGIWFLKQPKRKKYESLLEGTKDVIKKDRLFGKEIKDLKKYNRAIFIILMFVFFISITSVITMLFTPLLADSLNLDLMGIVLLFVLVKIPLLFCFFTHRLDKRFGEVNLVYALFLIVAVMLIAASYFQEISPLFFLIFFVIGACEAVAIPIVNGMLTQITPKSKQGETTGLHNTVLKGGLFVGPILGGMIADVYSISSLFSVAGVFLLIMTFYLLTKREELAKALKKFSSPAP